jgi:4,5-DOPA dioxygenase extradiol
MNALERNRYTETWRAFGASVPRPRAILMVSAHWYVNTTAVTTMARPKTIHDFYGFPRELFAIQYPAPGLPELFDEIVEVVKPTSVGADPGSWGLDHGTWSVLLHAFPAADIPVVQLSVDTRQAPEYHLELGAKLAALRDRGVLLMGSGNIVHNLRAIDWSRPDGAYDWATRFNESACEILAERPADAVSLMEHPDFANASPTPDHFLPLLYVAGYAAATSGVIDLLLRDSYAYGSLSMTCCVAQAAV